MPRRCSFSDPVVPAPPSVLQLHWLCDQRRPRWTHWHQGDDSFSFPWSLRRWRYCSHTGCVINDGRAGRTGQGETWSLTANRTLQPPAIGGGVRGGKFTGQGRRAAGAWRADRAGYDGFVFVVGTREAHIPVRTHTYSTPTGVVPIWGFTREDHVEQAAGGALMKQCSLPPPRY